MRFFRLLILAVILAVIAFPLDLAYSAPGSTYTATSVLDSVDAAPGDGECADSIGTCTLRAAVMETNASAGPDTIVLLADTYALTIAGVGEDDAATGDLDLKGDLTITGAGPDITIIDAVQSDDRVFDIQFSANVNISGVTARNSAVGGLLNSGTLSITNSIISRNKRGINNNLSANLTLTDSEVSGNTAGHSAGIYSFGKMTIINSIVSDNKASSTGGGGIVNNGEMTITNSEVNGNTAVVIGGGIINEGIMTITNSTVSDNEANYSSGGIHNSSQGTLTLTDSEVSGNNGYTYGGGLSNGGAMTITNSTVSDNWTISIQDSQDSPRAGGGLYNSGDTSILNSTISGNQTPLAGGGIRNYGRINLINSTISGNQANGSGGGIYNDATGTLDAHNATIVSNTANADAKGLSSNGGGIKNADGTANLFNTILGLNIHVIESGGFLTAVDDDCNGALNQLNYSLLTTTTGCTFTDDNSITGQNPKLDPLTANGGPTQTHALKAGSPAIDAGDPNGCKDADSNDLTTDQRGEIRPFDGDLDGTAVCDIGAYEFILYQQLTVDKIGAGDGLVSSSPAGIDCGQDCSAALPQDSLFTLMAAPDNGSAFSGWSGDCSGTGDCEITMDAQKTITATFETQLDLQLTINKDGTGFGRISSSPAGIDCGGDCSAIFAPDSLVTLTADPDAGSTFSGWSGACSGTGDCEVTMDAPKTVTAAFTATIGGLLKLFLPLSLR